MNCDVCDGSGYYDDPSEPCPKCRPQGEHTAEPWAIRGLNGAVAIVKADQPENEGSRIVYLSGVSHEQGYSASYREDAQRIVACVNACAGVEDPETAILNMRETIKIQTGKLIDCGDEKDRLVADRDRWKALAVEAGDALKSLRSYVSSRRLYTSKPEVLDDLKLIDSTLAKLQEAGE